MTADARASRTRTTPPGQELGGGQGGQAEGGRVGTGPVAAPVPGPDGEGGGAGGGTAVDPGEPVPRELYARDVLEVAPDLLNKLLVVAAGGGGIRAGRIVEVEAYRGRDDPAAHSYRGPTERTRAMFGPPGHLYVYLSYGIHWCANAVCDGEGVGAAVLLRALAPCAGLEVMRPLRRAARRDVDLCSGPAKLCQALGIDRAAYGADLVAGDLGVTIRDDGVRPPAAPVRTTRVGITAAAELPWRWYVDGDPNVSRR